MVMHHISTFWVNKGLHIWLWDAPRYPIRLWWTWKIPIAQWLYSGPKVIAQFITCMLVVLLMIIAHQSAMSHSTIATILKNKNKGMEAVKRSTSLKAMRIKRIWEMEKLIIAWIEDQAQKYIPLSIMMITIRAKICLQCKEKTGPH